MKLQTTTVQEPSSLEVACRRGPTTWPPLAPSTTRRPRGAHQLKTPLTECVETLKLRESKKRGSLRCSARPLHKLCLWRLLSRCTRLPPSTPTPLSLVPRRLHSTRTPSRSTRLLLRDRSTKPHRTGNLVPIRAASPARGWLRCLLPSCLPRALALFRSFPRHHIQSFHHPHRVFKHRFRLRTFGRHTCTTRRPAPHSRRRPLHYPRLRRLRPRHHRLPQAPRPATVARAVLQVPHVADPAIPTIRTKRGATRTSMISVKDNSHSTALPSRLPQANPEVA